MTLYAFDSYERFMYDEPYVLKCGDYCYIGDEIYIVLEVICDREIIAKRIGSAA